MPAVAVVPIVCAVLFLTNGMALVVATPTVFDAPFADIMPAEDPKVFVVPLVANITPTAFVVEIEHGKAKEQQNDD